MLKPLQFIPTHQMTQDDWLSYRYTGIGASEVGTIMGLDEYKSSIELYYDKIGMTPRYNFENLSMFLGKEQEEFIAKMWQYWDGTVEGMIRNYRNGNIIRRCFKVNAYVRNPDYPWLFVSLDRKICKHSGKGNGSLEIKTMSGYVADKWESGIPPKHTVQLQTQMLVCRFMYGELAIMEDNRNFEVIPFTRIQNICDGIVEWTRSFWERVEKGTKLVNQKFEAERNFNYRLANECQAEIDNLAPPPDGSMAYTEFLKKRFNNPALSERRGSMQEFEWARKHLRAKIEIDNLVKEKQLYENRLKNALGNHQILDFGKDGKVRWTKTSAGTRMFMNKIIE